MNNVTLTHWVLFNLAVIGLVILDAFVLNPKSKELTLNKAIKMTFFWVFLAILFNVGIYYWMGKQSAIEFFTGYVIEQSLSVDNLFVFLLIFSHFKTNTKDQRDILFWGIVSAQVMRAVFILVGMSLLHHFSWMIFIFGGILVFTGIRLFVKKDEEVEPEENLVYKLFAGKLSMFWLVFIMIQVTDLIFAIDSIPAVLAITKDPFIAYTSNIFAVLGLRSMYFALSSFMTMFHYLHYGLGTILIFVGLKMLLEHFIHIPIFVTLLFIITTLAITIGVSILCPLQKQSKS